MRRFEELCDLIAIERDVVNFSALVTELNELDPTHRLPVISRQPNLSHPLATRMSSEQIRRVLRIAETQ